MTNMQSQSNVAKDTGRAREGKSSGPAKKAQANTISLAKKIVRSLQSLRAFLGETQAELSKVSWLRRDKLTAYVTVVVVITGVITAYVTFADIVIAKAFDLIDYIFI